MPAHDVEAGRRRSNRIGVRLASLQPERPLVLGGLHRQVHACSVRPADVDTVGRRLRLRAGGAEEAGCQRDGHEEDPSHGADTRTVSIWFHVGTLATHMPWAPRHTLVM